MIIITSSCNVLLVQRSLPFFIWPSHQVQCHLLWPSDACSHCGAGISVSLHFVLACVAYRSGDHFSGMVQLCWPCCPMRGLSSGGDFSHILTQTPSMISISDLCHCFGNISFTTTIMSCVRGGGRGWWWSCKVQDSKHQKPQIESRLCFNYCWNIGNLTSPMSQFL